MVAQFFNGFGHIGEKEIKEIVGAFTTGRIEVDLIGGSVHITVTRDLADRFILSDCAFILNKRIPAHLGIEFSDILLPIRFYTNNRFLLESVRFASSFYNCGSDVILLDGQRLLNGLWGLNQNLGYHFAFESFKVIAGIKLEYKEAGLPILRIGVAPFKNQERSALFSFNFDLGAAQNIQSYSNPQISLMTATQNSYNLTGQVTIDSMYYLDGSVPLDGSSLLNAKYETEVL